MKNPKRFFHHHKNKNQRLRSSGEMRLVDVVTYSRLVAFEKRADGTFADPTRELPRWVIGLVLRGLLLQRHSGEAFVVGCDVLATYARAECRIGILYRRRASMTRLLLFHHLLRAAPCRGHTVAMRWLCWAAWRVRIGHSVVAAAAPGGLLVSEARARLGTQLPQRRA